MIDLGEIKYSILYVDDEQVNLDVFKSTFRWYYTVHTALSGKEGLEILEKEKIDMVITDQKMPGMSGVEFLKKIIPSYPDQVRIILTGYSDIEAIAYAINEVGIYQYIQKPWDADEMRHILNKALKQYQLSLDNKQLLIDLKVANEELKQINENLEEKVKERTAEVNLQKVELEEKNEKITSSINYAKRIQNSMLPPIEKVCGSFSDAFVYFRPRDIVSGDFYWHQCDGNRTVIAAVDCTGHGVPGAFMSLVGSELLNKIVNYKQIYDAAKILTELHIEIRSVLKQETSENRDGMDMSLVVIDREKKTIQFSGAKNPLIIIQNGEIQQIKGDKYPIGGLQKEDERIFTRHDFSIENPTFIYMFSDGYQDQFGGPDGRKFMIKKLRELIFDVHLKPMKEQYDIFDDTLIDWMKNVKQLDDILIMGFKI